MNNAPTPKVRPQQERYGNHHSAAKYDRSADGRGYYGRGRGGGYTGAGRRGGGPAGRRGRGGGRMSNTSRRGPPPNSNGARFATKAAPPPPRCSVCQEVENPSYKCPKCRLMYCSVGCCRQHKEICPGNVLTAAPKTTTTSIGEESLVAETAASSTGIQHNNYNDPSSQVLPNTITGNIIITVPDYAEYGPDWVLPLSSTREKLRDSADWLKRRLGADPGLRRQIATLLASPDTPVRGGGGGNKNTKRGSGAMSWTEREVMLEQLRTKNGGAAGGIGPFLEELAVIGGVLERHDTNRVPLHQWLNTSIDQRSQTNLCLVAPAVASRRQRIGSVSSLVQIQPFDHPDALHEAVATSDEDADDGTASSSEDTEEGSSSAVDDSSVS